MNCDHCEKILLDDEIGEFQDITNDGNELNFCTQTCMNEYLTVCGEENDAERRGI